MATTNDLREEVRQKYAEAATGGGCGCSDGGCCSDGGQFGSTLYDIAQRAELPETAVLASLGCGNPTAVADLRAGETVLDLGSGGGIDVILSAKRVGPTGHAYGLDMTEEMLELARRNANEAGIANVTFLQGLIEEIPLPDASVDVVISNCVINLSADKDQVLREAFRVLKPGGRFAVSDVVTRGEVPSKVRENMLLWVGCIAGALEDEQYRSKLARAGFADIEIEPTRVYNIEDARTFLAAQGVAQAESMSVACNADCTGTQWVGASLKIQFNWSGTEQSMSPSCKARKIAMRRGAAEATRRSENRGIPALARRALRGCRRAPA